MEKKKIVIAGAGFGGITAALKLAKKIGRLNEYEIILIDHHHHQLYTPALYEIAAIPRETAPGASLKSSILIPIADIIVGRPIQFICDEIVGIDVAKKKISLLKTGEITFEFLVLALGSETNYFDIPGLKENSLVLKTYNDAVKLRNKIEEAIKNRDGMKIVVVGGGASGVELIAEFVNFICALQKEVFKKENLCKVEFVLLEAGPKILGGFEPWITKKASHRLLKLGVQVKTGKTINSVDGRSLKLKDDDAESYDVLIWTGGVKGPAVLQKFGLPLSNKGALVVNDYLEVPSEDGKIFAIGDNSSLINPQTGKALPWNVPVAESEGRIVAKNILCSISGRPLKPFVPLKKYPYILAVGGGYAISDLVFVRFSGFLGLAVKALVELRYLLFILPLGKALQTWFRALKYYSSND